MSTQLLINYDYSNLEQLAKKYTTENQLLHQEEFNSGSSTADDECLQDQISGLEFSAKKKGNSNQLSNQSSANKKQNEEQKYKTELCKNFQSTGKCNYGKKCRFAHGKDELVSKPLANKNFKTKECKAYFEEMTCPYAHRCHFVHDVRSVDQIRSENYYQKRMNHPEIEEGQEEIKNNRRLPIFQQITGSNLQQQQQQLFMQQQLFNQQRQQKMCQGGYMNVNCPSFQMPVMYFKQ